MKTILFWIGAVIVGLLGLQIVVGLVSLIAGGLYAMGSALVDTAQRKVKAVA